MPVVSWLWEQLADQIASYIVWYQSWPWNSNTLVYIVWYQSWPWNSSTLVYIVWYQSWPWNSNTLASELWNKWFKCITCGELEVSRNYTDLDFFEFWKKKKVFKVGKCWSALCCKYNFTCACVFFCGKVLKMYWSCCLFCPLIYQARNLQRIGARGGIVIGTPTFPTFEKKTISVYLSVCLSVCTQARTRVFYNRP